MRKFLTNRQRNRQTNRQINDDCITFLAEVIRIKQHNVAFL